MTRRFEIRKGLDVPIEGEPVQAVSQSPSPRHVALVGDDYNGMKPTMAVSEGDTVKKGQLLFSDKKCEGVLFTAPAAGTVVAVNRGAKRKFESVVIELSGDEEETFASYPDVNLAQLDRDKVVENLVNSGLWPALRTRPYSKTPPIDSTPAGIFVTAMDTNPLAPDPAVALGELHAEFIAGLQAVSTLTEGETYLCKAPGAEIPGEDLGCVEVAEFSGPHPAGLPGTHIHILLPAHMERVAWHIGYQDVAAIGRLMLTGTLMTDRVVSIAGPAATTPRLVRVPLGANLTEITAGEINTTREVRVVSGSVLSGRASHPPVDFLGRFHTQISALFEGTQRDFVGWMSPGFNKFSVKRSFASSWLNRGRRFPLTTSTEGSRRAIVPLGAYEQVVPLDIIATPLLKALAVQDTEHAQLLGALELDEEDLALCTFVCPSKNDYGPMLRQSLTTIEHEG